MRAMTRRSDRYEKLVARVAGKAFDDVIPRFHTVARRNVEPRLYEIDGKDIIVGEKERMFLRENHKALDLLAVGAWVKFTEPFTSAPRLYEKIQGLEPTRSTLTPYRRFLLSLEEPRCFYCAEQVKENTNVDHVVPWSFIAEDKIWNLVLACDRCNSSKSSATPSDAFIDKLNERNQILEVDNKIISVTKIGKELAEWRGRELAEHIRMLVDRCRADGFGIWMP
jgi:5-methylcytosine-specific restriction endonuclease McrA